MKTKGFELSEDNGIFPNRTIAVGMQLNQQSIELLTWALVKVAEPGDRVVAFHVLGKNELLDRDGQSSLLSLVKSFDSMLAVYEGFCNLKQVDLKFKICRGSSVKRILVREAKSCSATRLILGVESSRPIWHSASIAKYCARKLPLDCGVFAVNNGKVRFQREATSPYSDTSKQIACKQSGFFYALHRTFSRTGKASGPALLEHPSVNYHDSMKNETVKQLSDFDGFNNGLCSASCAKDTRKKCSICAPFFVLPDDYLYHDLPSSICSGNHQDIDSRSTRESLALVPVQTFCSSNSISLLIKRMPETRFSWPLVQRSILLDRQESWEDNNITPFQQPMQSSAGEDPDDMTCCETENVSLALANDLAIHDSSWNYDKDMKLFEKEFKIFQKKYSSTCRLFDYEELVWATSNFDPGHLIGKGGSSKVYKGSLPDGKQMAVKVLKPSRDALSEFISEIEILTTINHENVISLFGFCVEDTSLLMVYDFLPRGSLEECLHGKLDKLLLGWSERYKVAIGIAEALNYLHSRAVQPVIHRDVKSSNILLDDNCEPQLSDFGLATWASSSMTQTCTDVAGTFGYLAPEYFMYGKVSKKIDVYAFGVVLLELLSGRKPISNEKPKDLKSLIMWAQPILSSGKYGQLLDPKLGDTYGAQIERMAMASFLCIRRAPRRRPRMGIVLKLLQGDEEVTKWARSQVLLSDEFGVEGPVTVPNLQCHLSLALEDVEDDSLSTSSTEPNIHCLTSNMPMEDYLQQRWSRSSSFE